MQADRQAPDRILGVALLGHSSGEVVAAVQMTMIGGLRYQQVRDAALTHPTMGEGLNLIFDAREVERSSHAVRG